MRAFNTRENSATERLGMRARALNSAVNIAMLSLAAAACSANGERERADTEVQAAVVANEKGAVVVIKGDRQEFSFRAETEGYIEVKLVVDPIEAALETRQRGEEYAASAGIQPYERAAPSDGKEDPWSNFRPTLQRSTGEWLSPELLAAAKNGGYCLDPARVPPERSGECVTLENRPTSDPMYFYMSKGQTRTLSLRHRSLQDGILIASGSSGSTRAELQIRMVRQSEAQIPILRSRRLFENPTGSPNQIDRVEGYPAWESFSKNEKSEVSFPFRLTEAKTFSPEDDSAFGSFVLRNRLGTLAKIYGPWTSNLCTLQPGEYELVAKKGTIGAPTDTLDLFPVLKMGIILLPAGSSEDCFASGR
jgi:hypothetical protein